MELNINENVKVKITEYGLKILEDNFNKLKKDFPSIDYSFEKPKVDEDGFSKMQLHEVMKTFGKYMYMGTTKYPIELSIIIEGKEDA